MHYQNDHMVAGDWLFGTTRATNLENTDRFIIVWKLDLDESLAPRIDNLQMLWLKDNFLAKTAHVTGVRPKMNGDKMSMVIMGINTDDQLYFVEVDFALLIIKTSLITEKFYGKSFTIFMGSRRKLAANGLTLYESYTVGTTEKIIDPLQCIFFCKSTITGAVFTTIIGSKDCSIDLSWQEK